MKTEFGTYMSVYKNPPFYRLGESMEKAKKRNAYLNPIPPLSIYAQYLYTILYENIFKEK